jgi:hypothetical protein
VQVSDRFFILVLFDIMSMLEDPGTISSTSTLGTTTPVVVVLVEGKHEEGKVWKEQSRNPA